MNVRSRLFPAYYLALRVADKLISNSVFSKIGHAYLHYKLGVKRPKLDLSSPATFSEKIIWLKLHRTIENGHILVDKYLVRKHVTSLVGEKYLVPLLGVFDEADDIDFESLPEKFVIKASHGSGWNIVCEERSSFNSTNTRKEIDTWRALNYYYFGREQEYSDCPPKIVIEKHLADLDNSEIRDYKFFCFQGEPKIIQVDVDRDTNHTQAFYTTDWKRLRFTQLYPYYPLQLEKPPNFEEMTRVASTLSKDLAFARIDLFDHGGKVYFGEITLHPHGGCAPFKPQKFDKLLGDLLHIS